MQEDVLKLILLTLEKGALIARKTLVMYVVSMLSEDYPQVGLNKFPIFGKSTYFPFY